MLGKVIAFYDPLRRQATTVHRSAYVSDRRVRAGDQVESITDAQMAYRLTVLEVTLHGGLCLRLARLVGVQHALQVGNWRLRF